MSPIRQGDWMCPECGNHNFASRQSCNRCGGPRVGDDIVYGGVRASAGQPRQNPYAFGALAAPRVPMMAAKPAIKKETGDGDLKEGDWLCPSCGNHNYASRVNCNKCQALREGMKQGDWVCRSCKNHNFKNKTACNRCAAPRPFEGGVGIINAPAGKGAMYGSVPYVGYANPHMGKGMVFPGYGYGKGMVPQMMMMPAPMMQQPMMQQPKNMKDGDWMCPSCGNHNFASRVNCNKCNALRAGYKDGDWICKGCKNHNFKSRTACNKCQSPKD